MNNIKYKKLKEIDREIKRCTKCPLHKTRNLPVPGEGSHNTEVILIGEAPGYYEDQKGRPFVGSAGKLLDELLSLAGLSREKVFITNILKCRPPENRNPTKEEIEKCTPYLDKQIRIIKPRIIITLGNVASSYILEKFEFKPESMWKMHGKTFQVSNLLLKTKIIPMYHPAAALHNPRLKETLKEDWKKIKEMIP